MQMKKENFYGRPAAAMTAADAPAGLLQPLDCAGPVGSAADIAESVAAVISEAVSGGRVSSRRTSYAH